MSLHICRKSQLAFYKLAEAKSQNKLECEACGFKGHPAYGDALERCFEVHHQRSISQGERVTDLDDLSLVCANCRNAIDGLDDMDFGEFLLRFRG